MAGFDVPEAMDLFYHQLAAAGWVNTTSQPDEWRSPDGQYEVLISHASQMCTIRYRQVLKRRKGESSDEYYRRRSVAPSSSNSRVHGQSITEFQGWLARTYQTIMTYCAARESVAAAPGEG
jgi:hypothetical protein